MEDNDTVHMAHGRTQEQLDVMRKIQQDRADPFDWDQLEKYHREPILWKGVYWLVTPNDYSYEGAKLHLLLIYREYVASFTQVPPAAFAELQKVLAWAEAEYKLTYGSFVMRFGDVSRTGASVSHPHAHLIVGQDKTNSEKLKVSIGYK